MIKKTRSEKDKVTIYYWKPNLAEESPGHVALRTYIGVRRDAGCYLSFYPHDDPNKRFVSSYEEDKKKRGGPGEAIDLYCLDIGGVHSAYWELYNSKPEWTLFSAEETKNCSTAVAFLLKAGGINNPKLFNFWSKIKEGSFLGGLSGGSAGGLAGHFIEIKAAGAKLANLIAQEATESLSVAAKGAAKKVVTKGLIAPKVVTAAAKAVPVAKAALTVPTLFPFFGGVVAVAMIGGVSFLLIGSIASGSLFGAVAGGACEYFFTDRLDKILLTPWDIYRLAQLAEKAEKDCNDYEFTFSVHCQQLIERCKNYSSSAQEEVKVVTKLKDYLCERNNKNIIDIHDISLCIYKHCDDALGRLNNLSLWTQLSSFLSAADTVKAICKDALALVEKEAKAAEGVLNSNPLILEEDIMLYSRLSDLEGFEIGCNQRERNSPFSGSDGRTVPSRSSSPSFFAPVMAVSEIANAEASQSSVSQLRSHG